MQRYLNVSFFNPAVLIMALILTSCAHDEGNLQLDSVLSVRLAKQRAEDAAKEKEKRAQLQLGEIIDQSTLKTQEIDLLELPDSFVRYTAEEIETLRGSVDFDIPPFVEVMWRDYKTRLTIMAGRVDWDPNFLRDRSQDDFTRYLSTDVARGYDTYFKRNYDTGATTNVSVMNGILTAKVTSKYLDEKWYTDIRYFFVYKEDYRLNLFVYGENESYEASLQELDAAISDFTSRLNRVFWEPLPFLKPDPDAPQERTLIQPAAEKAAETAAPPAAQEQPQPSETASPPVPDLSKSV